VGNNVTVWDPSTATEIFSVEGHAQPINSVDYSPDGSRLLSSGLEDSAFVWDANDGKLLFKVSLPASGSVAFSPDGTRIVGSATVNNIGMKLAWDARTGARLTPVPGQPVREAAERIGVASRVALQTASDETTFETGPAKTVVARYPRLLEGIATDAGGARWACAVEGDDYVYLLSIEGTIDLD
jgi:WD40 repeat protein